MAFYYHPLWVTLIPFAIAFFLFHFKEMRTALNISIGIFCTFMIAAYIYRLFFVPQDVVVFDPHNGAVVKLIKFIADAFTK